MWIRKSEYLNVDTQMGIPKFGYPKVDAPNVDTVACLC